MDRSVDERPQPAREPSLGDRQRLPGGLEVCRSEVQVYEPLSQMGALRVFIWGDWTVKPQGSHHSQPAHQYVYHALRGVAEACQPLGDLRSHAGGPGICRIGMGQWAMQHRHLRRGHMGEHAGDFAPMRDEEVLREGDAVPRVPAATT